MMPATRHSPADPDLSQQAELVKWFLRQNSPQWTPGDQAGFEQWLAAHPGHRAAYGRWEADWALMDDMPQAAAERLRAQVRADRRAAQVLRRAAVAPSRRRAMASGFALAGVAGLALSGGWFGWQHWQAQPVFEQNFHTLRGQQSELKLPDGTTLRLDTATSLKVSYFRQRREVHLIEGQALFSVAPDAERPFRVRAQAVEVTVIGTRFSVRLTPGVPGRDGVEVAVEEGRVHVEHKHPGGSQEFAAQAFDLSAGQRLIFSAQDGKADLGAVAADGVAPWRNARLSFSDVPLAAALAEMERYASLGITGIDPYAAELRLTGTFNPRDVAATRRLLAAALPVKLQPVAGGYEVVSAH